MNRILGSLALLGVVVVAALALRPPFPFDGKGPPKGYKLGKAPVDRERIGGAYLFRVIAPPNGTEEKAEAE